MTKELMDKLQTFNKREYKASTKELVELKDQIAAVKEIFPNAKVVARKELK